MNWQLIRCAFGKHLTVRVAEKKNKDKTYTIWPVCSYCGQRMSIHPAIWLQMREVWKIEKWGNPYDKVISKYKRKFSPKKKVRKV